MLWAGSSPVYASAENTTDGSIMLGPDVVGCSLWQCKRRSGFYSNWTQTMMSNPSLPPEILDCVIDLLHDEPETLKQCCLVSRSWVPRTRRHLFADVKFRSASDLESWKKAFPDTAKSPAYHAHTLFVGCPWLVTASDAEEGGWIRAFFGVASLHVDGGTRYLRAPEVSLAPFYQFSPSLKSLLVGPFVFPYPQVFDIILSFPLLEDLILTGYDRSSVKGGDPNGPRAVIPSRSPPLTGLLGLHIQGGAENTVRQLLELPNGLHFRKLVLSWACREDVWWITELVERCCHTLESLDITYTFRRTSIRIWFASRT